MALFLNRRPRWWLASGVRRLTQFRAFPRSPRSMASENSRYASLPARSSESDRRTGRWHCFRLSTARLARLGRRCRRGAVSDHNGFANIGSLQRQRGTYCDQSFDALTRTIRDLPNADTIGWTVRASSQVEYKRCVVALCAAQYPRAC